MSNIITSKAVRVYQTNDSIRYRLDLNEEIDAIIVKDDKYVKGKAKYIDFHPSVLVAQVIANVAGVDILYTKKKESAIRSGNTNGFGAAELQVVLRDAKIEIERNKFKAGEEYVQSDGTTATHEFDGYNTDIITISVSDKTQALLDRVIESVFSL